MKYINWWNLIVSQKFASNCDDNIQIVKLKAAEKQQVVDLHNFFRDKIANGDQPLFPVNNCVQKKFTI